MARCTGTSGMSGAGSGPDCSVLRKTCLRSRFVVPYLIPDAGECRGSSLYAT